jgi:hypothetical protein
MKRKLREFAVFSRADAFSALAVYASLAVVLCAFLSAPLSAQTHKVARPENVVRAVGVYEWTGDMAKPAASRIVPVTLFIDGKLQDAGVYLARPVPFALITGNIYELDQAGVPKGTVDLMFSRHFEPTDTASTTYDDGWFGYGKFAAPTPPKKSTLKPSKTLAVINAMDDDSDKPHFSSKSATPGSGGAATTVPAATTSTDAPPDDPDRPTMKRHADTSDQTASTGSSTTASSDPSSTPSADPNRPTLHRTGASDQTASTGSAPSATGTTTPTSGTSGSSTTADTHDTPLDDADRPTLRRRTPEEAKKNKAASQASVSAVGSLNDDPNRPTLHRGQPAGAPAEAELPRLSGLPGDQDLHQMVAVSDAADRPLHDFTRAFADDTERQAVLLKMQTAARAQLTAYEATNAVASATPSAAASTPDTRHPNSKLRRAPAPAAPPPPPEPLLDEQLKAYTLSYGGAPTYIYSAHTDGLGPTLRFVTVVAQINMQSGEAEFAIKSVTDATHLDRTPRMKLVDVVDAEASNRASLLFELRQQNSRQFALYRVIGARADEIFLTGTTQ